MKKVLEGIVLNTTEPYELIVVIDGCTDNSEKVIWETLSGTPVNRKIIYAPNVFETKANNLGLKIARGDKVIIVQDDMIIREKGWNVRMEKPFKAFSDVFAVTSRTAHNWIFNPNSKHLDMEDDLEDCWCDILEHIDHADRKHTLLRDIFAVRCSVNRGPLMIDHVDLKNLITLMKFLNHKIWMIMTCVIGHLKNLEKVVGAYWIDYVSDDAWGGTRMTGGPAPWLLKAQHKNTKIFYERHKDLINTRRMVENRTLE